jgi:glutamate N-acetyltransferase/amino-acid N-acetyltransferase
VKRSFDRISVDGQLSTNDTVILMASGASGVSVEPESDDELRFGEALDALLRQLALRIVADGEGAGGSRACSCAAASGGVPSGCARGRQLAARQGGAVRRRPNWGRIAQAVGAALPGSAPLRFDIAIEGITVARDGARSSSTTRRARRRGGPRRGRVRDRPARRGREAELFFSDLGYDYVKINAEYTT